MLAYFEQAAEHYLELLEKNDDNDLNTVTYSKEEIQQKLSNATQRIHDLTEIKQQVETNDEASLTDKDARLMSVNNMGFDVAYNMQTAVDAKNHIIVAMDITNSPADQGQLYTMAVQAKQLLNAEKITVLADKGYYTGQCLEKCEQGNIIAIVSKQNPPSSTGNSGYTLDKFKYDPEKDYYSCPQGETLCNVSSDDTKEKLYRSKACKTCLHKDECTKNKRGRQIIHKCSEMLRCIFTEWIFIGRNSPCSNFCKWVNISPIGFIPGLIVFLCYFLEKDIFSGLLLLYPK